MSHHHWHGGSVDCFAAQAAWPCPTRKQRSLVLCPAISLVPVYPSGSYNHPSRDAHPLAPIWLSLLLTLEVTIFGRPAADRAGAARVDPADVHGEPSLGRATHPRRTSQTWV